MSWTYSGDPFSSELDSVRFLLGDTDTTDKLPISDEEVTWLLSENNDNVYFAAAAAAEQVAGQFAREVPYAADGVSYGGDELQNKYMSLAAQLREEGKRRGRLAAPYDGSNRCLDWRENVERISIGMNDIRREGANMPTGGDYLNPLTGDSDSPLAMG